MGFKWKIEIIMIGCGDVCFIVLYIFMAFSTNVNLVPKN